MNVLVNCLIYGNRPIDTILYNLENAGHSFHVKFINKEGIANALNEGLINYQNYDAIAFLANDIKEPEGWLSKKIEALQTYHKAGIVASSLDNNRFEANNEHVISNWLISKELIDAIGNFNDEFYPYGAIDLDYCERAWLAGFCTYYVKNCLAVHNGSHASGDEYGWNKGELVSKYSDLYNLNIEHYKNGTKSIKR